MKTRYENLLGTPLISDYRPTRESRGADRSGFWHAWLLAVVVLTPAGVAYGKLAAARKIAQMQECVSQSGNVDSCRRTHDWPFKSFNLKKPQENT